MGSLDATAALLAAARWLVSLAAILLIGAAAALVVIRRAQGPAVAAIAPLVQARTARAAIASGVGLAMALGGLLAVQAYAWFGAETLRSFEPIRTMVQATRWGQNWVEAMGGAVMAVPIVAVAARWRAVRLPALALAALVVALTVPLVGHGASHGVANWLTHAAHLTGAGLWIGALAVFSRATWVVWRDDSPSPDALRSLLAAFSPMALAGAGLLALSGFYLAVEHVTPPSALWTTEYGRTLAAKLVVVGTIAGVGWRNWQRLTPAVDTPAGRAALRRSVRLELVLSLGLVLAVTGWLAGLPIPAPE